MQSPFFRFHMPLLALLLVTSSCAVGPDFKTPAAPGAKRYTDVSLPEYTGSAKTPAGEAQHFTADQDLPRNWWVLFGSEPLNKLMNEALASNPDLQAAKATLTEAHENVLAEAGTLFPSINANLGPTREKINGAAFGAPGFPSSIYTLYNASLNASYSIDVFGGSRRAIEAARAQEDYARFEEKAAYLTLTTNLVTTAIQEASLRDQIAVTQDTIRVESNILKVLKAQFELGGIARTSELQQEATLAQAKATLPPLEKQLTVVRNQLAILTGHTPDTHIEAEFTLKSLHLPTNLPVSLPSKLVEQRPDIKAAEAQLHVATADVGVATANMLPQITLSGSYGFETTGFRDIFTPGANVFSIGANLLQPIFHGGTLLHQRRAAVAELKRAAAQYQSTVLSAFANVGDALRALQLDADTLAAEVDAEAAAAHGLDLAHTQYQEGGISYPQLLDTQITYQQARLALVQAQAARFADTAALYQALGGGWWGKDIAPVARPTETLATPSSSTISHP